MRCFSFTSAVEVEKRIPVVSLPGRWHCMWVVVCTWVITLEKWSFGIEKKGEILSSVFFALKPGWFKAGMSTREAGVVVKGEIIRMSTVFVWCCLMTLGGLEAKMLVPLGGK